MLHSHGSLILQNIGPQSEPVSCRTFHNSKRPCRDRECTRSAEVKNSACGETRRFWTTQISIAFVRPHVLYCTSTFKECLGCFCVLFFVCACTLWDVRSFYCQGSPTPFSGSPCYRVMPFSVLTYCTLPSWGWREGPALCAWKLVRAVWFGQQDPGGDRSHISSSAELYHCFFANQCLRADWCVFVVRVDKKRTSPPLELPCKYWENSGAGSLHQVKLCFR